MQDAARAACVSGGFLHSWTCYSKLILNYRTLGMANRTFKDRETYFIKNINQVIENHHKNGVKVETLKLQLRFMFVSYGCIKASTLDRWLQITVKSRIKELELAMPLHMEEEYNFPCAALSDEAAASSIQSLSLSSCAFHPTSSPGLLRRLTCLHMSLVRITEEGLLLLLSKCSVLERLEISHCSGIICLRVASTMQQLKYISVSYCTKLQVVQIDAPKLCSFHCDGFRTEISVTNSSQLKSVDLLGALSDARARLPSIIGHVESLTLCSSYLEVISFGFNILMTKLYCTVKCMYTTHFCWKDA